MLSLIRIRIKYLIRHPCLLFWSYLFLPLLILIIAIFKLKDGPNQYELQITEEPYSIKKEYTFFQKQISYFNLYKYWRSTVFVVNKEEDCTKIQNFFNESLGVKNINCSLLESNVTIKTENIIKIKRENEKYRVYLTSREKNVTKSNKNDNMNISQFMNMTELDELAKLLNQLNFTNATDGQSLIEELEKIDFSKVLDILNITVPSGFPEIKNINDLLKMLAILNQTDFGVSNKIFDKNDIKQDLITDPFFVNEAHNDTILSKFDIFFDLQSLLARIILLLDDKKEQVKNPKSNFIMKLGYNPYPNNYRFTDNNGSMFRSFLSFIITLQFSLIAYNFNLRMIDEKENKLNILLERQGISKLEYNASWLITFYSLFLLTIIAFTLYIFSIIIFHHLLFIIDMILFSFCIFCVCIFFTTWMKTTKGGTTAVKFYNFGSILLGFVIVLPDTNKLTKIIFSFIPQINFYSSINCIFSLNNFDTLSWEKMRLKAAKMSIIEVIIMYIVDIIFYLGMSVFIQSYRDSGLHFFPYLKSFFTKVSRISNIPQNSSLLIENENSKPINFEIHHQELSPVNQQKKEQNQCLRLINVSKNFGDLKAVDNFNGELFTNEIFCLLGHNGAGKSTTINMISGIFDPDYGDITLDGRSLVTDKNYLYKNIGLCQQEDIYFDYLTVEEHLEYMCRIKGSKINKEQIDDLINKIELSPKKNALCSTLSGGQKRKLCIALALIGNSKIILLDEPTSGMDVMARRSLWEFLKNYRKDKILLLTTHFLDEAEYLGDRIGIMSDGHFLCSGTSSFLKSKYPCGFNINLLINSSIFNEDYKNQIYQEILKFEPNAEIKVASKSIFSINIQSNNQHIPEIFDYIEQNKSQFGIEDYTVSSTSLEDVFLKINNKANLNDIKYLNKEDNKEQPFMNAIPTSAGFFNQLCAQIIRGLYPFYRNKTIFFFELLSGLGFVYIFIFFFSDFIINAAVKKLNFIEILEANKIFIYEKNTVENFLKNSDVYSNIGKYISLNSIEQEPKSIEDLMNLAYKDALANIAKGAIYVNATNKDLYQVYNTEVDTSLNGYFYANTILFVSAFLKEEFKIDVTIFPEITYNAIGGDSSIQSLVNLISNSFVLIIVCLISVFGFVIFLGGLMFEKIKEKRTNVKHLLYLSGSNIWSYWIGFFIVDYIKLLFFNILLIFPIYFVNNSATYFGINLLAISLSSLSFIYFISFFCSKDDDGAKILFLVVFGFIIIVAILAILLQDYLLDYITSITTLYYPNIFDFTPITSMGLSFIRIIISFNVYDTIDKLFEELGPLLNEKTKQDILNEVTYGLGRPKEYLYTSFIAQSINLVFYSALLILAETGILERFIHRIELKLYGSKDNYIFSQGSIPDELSENNITSSLIDKPQLQGSSVSLSINDESNPVNSNQTLSQNYPQIIKNNNPSSIYNPLNNPYVKKEMEKVNNNQKELSTKISGVVKTFYSCCGRRNVRAINNLYLGLEPNEKFGLLGFNGSGKTTTFRAITNEILIDSGSVSLFGFNTQTDFERIRTMIGYCPQINPLFDLMKVREIIKFYSNLKTCNDSVESVCQKFGLSKYLDTYTINLSGGNKRKLTFAIAMMNRPSLLLLDEPSTGVDPESRRIMWRNINELSNTGHKYNMILTTHSMEEAEVLCDTVSWFKAGNFITKGNPEELKIKYSAGYKLHVKFDESIVSGNTLDVGNDFINETYNTINGMVEGFGVFYNEIIKNTRIEPYLKGLINVVQRIKDKTEKISLSLIGKDYSFELIILIKKERQKELFTEVLNMKNTEKSIGEMSISMQSLENILTSLN